MIMPSVGVWPARCRSVLTWYGKRGVRRDSPRFYGAKLPSEHRHPRSQQTCDEAGNFSFTRVWSLMVPFGGNTNVDTMGRHAILTREEDGDDSQGGKNKRCLYWLLRIDSAQCCNLWCLMALEQRLKWWRGSAWEIALVVTWHELEIWVSWRGKVNKFL